MRKRFGPLSLGGVGGVFVWEVRGVVGGVDDERGGIGGGGSGRSLLF